jgi:uncharacterized protein YndB with AHSA1/START domain
MNQKKPFSIEFDFHASPQLLFQYLSTPSGLSEWFADNVNSRGEDFTFIWDDGEEYAKLLYFEFVIQVDAITKDVSLIINDFAEEEEIEESKMFWDNSITALKQVLGSA